jgi:transitional endoplasmic reticulum ATPase
MSDSHSLREALRHSPDNVPLLLLYAEAALTGMQIEEARRSFAHVVKLVPHHREAALGVIRTFFIEGRLSEAAVRLEALLDQAPDFAVGHVFMARIHHAEGSRDEAIESYRIGARLDKNAVDPSLAAALGIEASGQETGAPPRRAQAHTFDGFQSFDPDHSASTPPGMGLFDTDDDDADADGGNKLVPVERPKTNFTHVGGMEALKEQIRMKILYPMTHADLFRSYGKTVGGGVLLYGPPGCGKTLISRATAGEIKANFFCIALHEVLDMWIGNSEKNLHQVFELARAHAPSVLFFDEVDALAADRKDMRQSAGRTMINQFLAEMDGGTSDNSGVLILGATNAPWHIDSAFRRPGRFDRTIFVPPPDEIARAGIIKVMAEGKPVTDLDAAALAKRTDGFSGADLKAVFDVAIEAALTTAMKEGRLVPLTTKSLIQAAKELKPSTKAWFESAKNYALYANQGGHYDDVLVHLGLKKP